MATPLTPPFNLETAKQKVQRAESLWNSKNPQQVALAYTEDSLWRNRDEFVRGREEIVQLLTRKWERELDYTLKKKLFTFSNNRIAVHFYYEYHNDRSQWFSAYGNEHWEFNEQGLMHTRDASINERAIALNERKL